MAGRDVKDVRLQFVEGGTQTCWSPLVFAEQSMPLMRSLTLHGSHTTIITPWKLPAGTTSAQTYQGRHVFSLAKVDEAGVVAQPGAHVMHHRDQPAGIRRLHVSGQSGSRRRRVGCLSVSSCRWPAWASGGSSTHARPAPPLNSPRTFMTERNVAAGTTVLLTIQLRTNDF